MFDHSYFTGGVIGIVIHLIGIYKWIIIIRVLISWINPDPYNPIVQFLRAITDPALDAMRRIMPRFLWSTGLDFTPLLLILLLQVLVLFLESIRV
ncbi:MAG: YggT family protein [Candidatus Latescibacteria bacterium]|nr:YggT family protein [Candidatus Latescibacterota bacterium]